MKKKILIFKLVIIFILNMVFAFIPYDLSINSCGKVKAATFNDINQDSVFVKQQTNVSCTLASSVMLLRRVAIMTDSDWSSITEDSLKPYAWITNKGLKGTFTYNGITVTSKLFGSDKEGELKKLLTDHPEGIIVYDKDRNPPHAILITDYTNGTFYCADPALNKKIPRGRIPISSAAIQINHIEKYWYVVSPDVSLTGGSTAPSISNVLVTNVSSNGYKVSCNISDDIGVTKVKFPTWTAKSDQDDIVWYDGTINGNTVSITINTSNHKNEIGTYFTHIYAYDSSGNYSSSGVSIEIPTEIDTIPIVENPPVTIAPIAQDSFKEYDLANVSEDGSVLVSTISSPDDLQDMIDTDLAYSNQDIFTTNNGKSNVYKFNVNEEGWIFISCFHTETHYSALDITLYTNPALTSKLKTNKLVLENSMVLAVYVDIGDYYYQINHSGVFNSEDTCTCYVGFMPSYARINVGDITYSKDKSTATVQFDIDEEYYNPASVDTIRIVNGTVSYKDLHSSTKWIPTNMDNKIKNNSITLTQNGTYSVRMAGSSDDYWCKISFEITDISSDSPSAPSIKTYKQNTKTVSGIGVYGTTVYVKVNGKYYDTVVDQEGKWTVTVPTLKKGIKITTYAKNSAGVKSKTSTVTVK